MKLALLTYNLAKTWDLDRIINAARAYGFAGIEFRAEANHAHGVELERTAGERREILNRLQDAYLEVACIGTSSRFENPDPAERQKMIDRTKRYIELASDLSCERIRVFGNDIPQGADRDDVVQYVGESLAELGEFAEPYDVDVLLEMHGQFNYWGFSRTAVEIADHPNVGLVYNCDPRDLVAGSVEATYSRVREWIRHVHMHAFVGPFPYPELFDLLQADGYEGYCSSEVDQEVPTVEHFLGMYANLFRAWAGLPFFQTPKP
ncbi:MAG: sugar phosphate isomerase/epimerase [Anaerolineae bacterium]|nr:sugar phosphate isomerase/epimerase [Anaerolineae bacterium]